MVNSVFAAISSLSSSTPICASTRVPDVTGDASVWGFVFEEVAFGVVVSCVWAFRFCEDVKR